jgi:hypothetical protein
VDEVHRTPLVGPRWRRQDHAQARRQTFAPLPSESDALGPIYAIDAFVVHAPAIPWQQAVAATNAIPSPQWAHLTHSNAIAATPSGGAASGSAPHADSRFLVFDAAGNLLESNEGGIARRTSPQNNINDWFSLNNNLQITELHDIAHDPVSSRVISHIDLRRHRQRSLRDLDGSLNFWNRVGAALPNAIVMDHGLRERKRHPLHWDSQSWGLVAGQRLRHLDPGRQWVVGSRWTAGHAWPPSPPGPYVRGTTTVTLPVSSSGGNGVREPEPGIADRLRQLRRRLGQQERARQVASKRPITSLLPPPPRGSLRRPRPDVVGDGVPERKLRPAAHPRRRRPGLPRRGKTTPLARDWWRKRARQKKKCAEIASAG